MGVVEEPVSVTVEWLPSILLMATAVVALHVARHWVAFLSPERGPEPEVRWGWRGVVFVILCGLLSPVFLAGRPQDGVVVLFLRTAAVDLVAIAACIAVVRRSGSALGATFGLVRGGNPGAVVAGLGAGLILEPALLGLMGFWSLVSTSLGMEVEMQPVLESILSESGGALLFAAVFAVLVVPLLEEVVFRGFLQPWLTSELGLRGGIVMTSIAFAALHGSAFFVPIFALSLLLGWLRVRTGRLTSCWAAHALNNGLTLTLGLAAQSGHW